MAVMAICDFIILDAANAADWKWGCGEASPPPKKSSKITKMDIHYINLVKVSNLVNRFLFTSYLVSH